MKGGDLEASYVTYQRALQQEIEVLGYSHEKGNGSKGRYVRLVVLDKRSQHPGLARISYILLIAALIIRLARAHPYLHYSSSSCSF